jgi:hypothetical protein
LTEIEKGRLDELADEIIAEHRAFVRTFRKAVEHGIRAGELLTEVKGNYEHGTWLPWLKGTSRVLRAPHWRARSRAFSSSPPGLSHSLLRISIHRRYKAHSPDSIGPGESEGSWPCSTGAMQDLGYDLPRIHLLGRSVNKGKQRMAAHDRCLFEQLPTLGCGRRGRRCGLRRVRLRERLREWHTSPRQAADVNPAPA